MEEQILNEHKMARKVVGMLVSKSLMDLVRAALDKLGEADKSAEDILFTAEGAEAKKEIMDAVAKLLGCEQPVAKCSEEVCPECYKDPCECGDKEDLQEGLIDKIKQIIKGKKSDTQAIQDISDIIEFAPIIWSDDDDDKPKKQGLKIRVDEALHGPFEIETFFKMAKDIGIDKLSDLEKFLKNEAEPGESEWETMLRYRASLGNDFKIDPKKNESVEKGEKCVICGKEIKGYGNNPAPIKDSGKCCDDCNATKVIPARLKAAKKSVREEFKESDGAVEAKEEPKVLPELKEGCNCNEDINLSKYPLEDLRALQQDLRTKPNFEGDLMDLKGGDTLNDLMWEAVGEVFGEGASIEPNGINDIYVYVEDDPSGYYAWTTNSESQALIPSLKAAKSWEDVYKAYLEFLNDFPEWRENSSYSDEEEELDESVGKREDRHCRCKKGKSKFRRDDFKFDDNFYGECVHKDCDEDDDEVEMIFDDDPTISY